MRERWNIPTGLDRCVYVERESVFGGYAVCVEMKAATVDEREGGQRRELFRNSINRERQRGMIQIYT